MSGQSTTEAYRGNFSALIANETYREKQRNLYVIFVDLKKTYDKIFRKLI